MNDLENLATIRKASNDLKARNALKTSNALKIANKCYLESNFYFQIYFVERGCYQEDDVYLFTFYIFICQIQSILIIESP